MACYFLSSSYHNTKLRPSDKNVKIHIRLKFQILLYSSSKVTTCFVVFLHVAQYKKDTKRRCKIVRVYVSTASCKLSIAHNLMLNAAGVITKSARNNKYAMYNVRVPVACKTPTISYTVNSFLLSPQSEQEYSIQILIAHEGNGGKLLSPR